MKLYRKQKGGSPLSSRSQSDDDDSYKPRLRTPPSESFSYNEECHHRQKSRSLAYKGLRNDAMSKALCQTSKSPFTRRIEKEKLPWRFTQPMFIMYNAWTDLVEHVSHFNQWSNCTRLGDSGLGLLNLGKGNGAWLLFNQFGLGKSSSARLWRGVLNIAHWSWAKGTDKRLIDQTCLDC